MNRFRYKTKATTLETVRRERSGLAGGYAEETAVALSLELEAAAGSGAIC